MVARAAAPGTVATPPMIGAMGDLEAAPAIRRCSVDEALSLLASPDAAEEGSAAHGCAALVVDGGPDEWPHEELTTAQRHALEWLPCVTVAPGDGAAWRRFDVVAQAQDTVDLATADDLLVAVAAHP